MEDRHILAEDIQDVIGQAESSGKRLFNQETGHYLASASPASVTYWVEYSPRGPAFEVHNAYSHRMVITRQAPS
jgi:hypothetical protein